MRPFKWWKEKSVAETSSRPATDGTRSIMWLEDGESRGGGSRTAGVPQDRALTSPECLKSCSLRLALAPELRMNSYPVAPYHCFLLPALFQPPRPVAMVTYIGTARQALEHFITALPQSHSNRCATSAFGFPLGNHTCLLAQASSPEDP